MERTGIEPVTSGLQSREREKHMRAAGDRRAAIAHGKRDHGHAPGFCAEAEAEGVSASSPGAEPGVGSRPGRLPGGAPARGACSAGQA